MKNKKLFFLSLSFIITSFLAIYFYHLKSKLLQMEEIASIHWYLKADPSFSLSSSLPPHLLGAILIREDGTFFSHHGISVFEIKEAFFVNLNTLSFKRGGSTITQQLIKNLYFDKSQKSVFRKLLEVPLAFALENKLSKHSILDLYIKIIEWGPDIYGIDQACQVYFNKPPAYLNVQESIQLASLIRNPTIRGKKLLTKTWVLSNRYYQKEIKKLIQQKYLPEKS